jgi:WhiB family redox-sensing transcriptional regulator
VDPEIFFPAKGGTSRVAKAICAKCPVRIECLNYAMRVRVREGIWGGASERDRRRLRRLSVT